MVRRVLSQISSLPRVLLAGLAGVVVVIVVMAVILLPSGSAHAPAAHAAAADLRAVAPAASLAPAATRAHATAAAAGPTNAGRRAPTATKGAAGLTPDPEAANSSPAPADVQHASATTPGVAAAVVASGAPSDAQVRRELQQMDQAVKAQSQQSATAATPSGPGGSVGGNGTVKPPPGIPAVIARVMAGANAIATFPYRFGGGHASFVDNAYDCSGSVSYALAAGGLIAAPVASGDLESWGVAGPGRWITVLANAGHTYMYVDGLRFDTSGRSGVLGSRWQNAARSNAGFVARHWPGL